MTRLVATALALTALTAAVRGDEADDLLCRQLVAVVRDPRQPDRARVEAARTIARLGPRAAAVVPDLVAQLARLRGAELEPVQRAVVDALGQIGGPARPALPALARATGRSVDVDLAIRRATDQILTAPDAVEVGLLMQQLGSRDASLRLRAAKALGGLGPAARAAAPALVAALSDADGDVRRTAAGAIRRVQPDAPPPDALVRAIAQDLRDPDDSVRLLAARTLGRLGPQAAPVAAALEPLLSDPDRDVRKAAADALARITPP